MQTSLSLLDEANIQGSCGFRVYLDQPLDRQNRRSRERGWERNSEYKKGGRQTDRDRDEKVKGLSAAVWTGMTHVTKNNAKKPV
jgi:hypothetical protein